MTRIIALAGKGGTGKTTTAALLINYLKHRRLTPVLAVDADANANLNELLGLTVDLTVGEIRQGVKGEMPPSMTRDQYMEMQLHQALVEATGFDLLVMGRPDGPGCYCAANSFLAAAMDSLAGNYRFLLVDNEAGMEHLSRMNLRRIDLLLVVSDASARGIQAASRIAGLTVPLGVSLGRQALIVNRAPEPVPPALAERVAAAEAAGLPLAGYLPEDDTLAETEIRGGSYLDLTPDLPILARAFALFDQLIGPLAA
ncbi:MAG: AAA family ATPase [Thermodesulfobacteriota bacterium]